MTDYVTVGDLRATIADLPDDMPVLTVDHHDDGRAVNKLHIDVVKETRPGSGRFETWFTPEEFAQLYDEDGNPTSPYSEKDRPPADGVRALTLWP